MDETLLLHGQLEAADVDDMDVVAGNERRAVVAVRVPELARDEHL
jgi:hypothetical protein